MQVNYNLSAFMENEYTPLVQQRVTYKSKLKISLLAWNITLSSFYFGYCIVYLGSIPTSTLRSIYGITLENSITEGILNGCIPIGALIGALCSSIIIPKFSRKNCLLIINAFAFVVGFLIYIEYFPSLVFFRLCQGFCVGFYSAIVPLIVNELSPIQISGSLGTFTQLNVTLGVFLGVFISYVLRKITGDETANDYWFLVFGVPQFTILIQSLVLLFVFPYETPKYLLSVGKQEEAKRLIELIYKSEYVDEILEEKKAGAQLPNIDEIATQSKEKQRKSNPITVVVAIHLAILQQFCGVNAVAIYGGKIAQKATTGELSLLMGSLINFEQVLACFITGIVVTKLGRKAILQIGSFSIGVANLLITVGFFIQSSQPNVGQGLILVGLFMFMGFFGFSLGPVVWLYIPEIVQPNIVPYSTASNWIFASIVIILFPIITDNVLGGNPAVLFAIFTVWMFVSLVFNHFFVLETKDKQEKEIISDYERIKLC